jgi:glycosyltransferase involved in cell wall biosynthesis
VTQLPSSSSAPGSGLWAVPARRLRVMHLLHTMAYGGVETTLINWVRKMDRDRFEVHLVCFANPGSTEMPFVKAAEGAGLCLAGKLPWRKTKPIMSAARKLRDLIRQHRIDILHSHNCYADVVALVARMMVPVKLVTTLYVWGDFGWKRNIIQWLNEQAVRRFDLVTVHCEDTLAQTLARGFRPERVKLLISGFEADHHEMAAEERRERRRERGVSDKEVVLANIARFYPEKAHDSLLRSFREISARHPEARLWLFGVGPLEDDLRRLCTELGLDDRVTFLGFVEDLPGILPLVDIQVHPSHMEGVALAVCSGMAAGLPIVASDVGGLREVLKHGETGFLVPPGDERGFTEAVVGLIEQPERARRLGQAARHFMLNDYSLERAVGEVQKTYLELMGQCI